MIDGDAFGLMVLSEPAGVECGGGREEKKLREKKKKTENISMPNPAGDLCKGSQRVRVFRSFPFQTPQPFHRRRRRTAVKKRERVERFARADETMHKLDSENN